MTRRPTQSDNGNQLQTSLQKAPLQNDVVRKLEVAPKYVPRKRLRETIVTGRYYVCPNRNNPKDCISDNKKGNTEKAHTYTNKTIPINITSAQETI